MHSYTAIISNDHKTTIRAASMSEAWEAAIEWAEDLPIHQQPARLTVARLDMPAATVRGEIVAGRITSVSRYAR